MIDDAGELWPSIEVSRHCFDEDVDDDAGEFAPLELTFLFFDPILVAIITAYGQIKLKV